MRKHSAPYPFLSYLSLIAATRRSPNIFVWHSSSWFDCFRGGSAWYRKQNLLGSQRSLWSHFGKGSPSHRAQNVPQSTLPAAAEPLRTNLKKINKIKTYNKNWPGLFNRISLYLLSKIRGERPRPFSCAFSHITTADTEIGHMITDVI